MTDSTNPKDLLGIKKVSLTLVPPSSIIYQALAMEDGARKYGPYNWREKKVRTSIYIDAALRHIQSYFDGEELAEDSQKPHLGHALACLGIIIDAATSGNLIDDRPKAGVASSLLKKYSMTPILAIFVGVSSKQSSSLISLKAACAAVSPTFR